MTYSGRWNRRPGKRVVAALLCVQVAVPVWATMQGPPRKFGFHMFTGDEAMSVRVLDDAGRSLPVDLSDWIVVQREDIDWAERLSPAICADVDEAAVVIVRQWKKDRVFTC